MTTVESRGVVYGSMQIYVEAAMVFERRLVHSPEWDDYNRKVATLGLASIQAANPGFAREEKLAQELAADFEKQLAPGS